MRTEPPEQLPPLPCTHFPFLFFFSSSTPSQPSAHPVPRRSNRVRYLFPMRSLIYIVNPTGTDHLHFSPRESATAPGLFPIPVEEPRRVFSRARTGPDQRRARPSLPTGERFPFPRETTASRCLLERRDLSSESVLPRGARHLEIEPVAVTFSSAIDLRVRRLHRLGSNFSTSLHRVR